MARKIQSEAIQALTTLRGCLEIRRKTCALNKKEAIENERWSLVAGWDGMEIGIIAAIKDLDNEIKSWTTKPI